MIRPISLLTIIGFASAAVAACSGAGFDGGFPAQNQATENDAATSTESDGSIAPTKDASAGPVSCKGTRADCNKQSSDGCEVDTASSPKNCGSCGHACATGQVCAKGACVGSCPSPLVDCGGACVDTTINLDHCGGCNRPCSAGANATALCENASCTSQCNAGYETCATGCCEKTVTPPPPPLQPGASIASGANHSCAITSGGGLKCWGANTSGKLGDGTAVDRKTPVKVSGLSSSVKAVGTGSNHTCALLGTGEVRCWGANIEGQLGNGSTLTSKTAVTVTGLASGAIALVVGRDHACVIVAGGSVKCWGANDRGQLGDGTHGSSDEPLAVGSIARPAVALAAGSAHTCALLDDASVVCWGGNDHGQLGDGTADEQGSPTAAGSLPSGVTAISAGVSHTCALAGHKVFCWGANDRGQLGDGTNTERWSPVEVDGLDSAVQVDAGTFHTCAVDSGGMVSCWGEGANGQLGDGIVASSPTLVQVDSLNGIMITEVGAGSTHTCARTQGANVKCWGANTRGQLGNGTIISSSVPVAVSGF